MSEWSREGPQLLWGLTLSLSFLPTALEGLGTLSKWNFSFELHQALVLRENWLLPSTPALSICWRPTATLRVGLVLFPLYRWGNQSWVECPGRWMARKRQSCPRLDVSNSRIFGFFSVPGQPCTLLGSDLLTSSNNDITLCFLSSHLPHRLHRARQAFPHWTQSLLPAQCLTRYLFIDCTNPYVHTFFPYSTKVCKSVGRNKMGVQPHSFTASQGLAGLG